MSWKITGAVERGVTSRPRNNLADGAGVSYALRRNGYFALFPHLSAAFAGVSFLGLGALAFIGGALLVHAPRCTGPTQADRCPLAGSSKASVSNTSLGNKK